VRPSGDGVDAGGKSTPSKGAKAPKGGNQGACRRSALRTSTRTIAVFTHGQADYLTAARPTSRRSMHTSTDTTVRRRRREDPDIVFLRLQPRLDARVRRPTPNRCQDPHPPPTLSWHVSVFHVEAIMIQQYPVASERSSRLAQRRTACEPRGVHLRSAPTRSWMPRGVIASEGDLNHRGATRDRAPRRLGAGQ